MLLLLACHVDATLTGKADPPDSFETGAPPTPPDTDTSDSPPPGEECNAVDDDGDGEIDEGYGDLDGDGIADCVDDACTPDTLAAGDAPVDTGCGGVTGWEPPADPGDFRVEWTVTGPAVTNTPVIASLTDDNGDGHIDDADVPDILVVDFNGGELSLYSGDGGALHWQREVAASPMAVAVADVDADGVPNILYASRGSLFATEPDGTLTWQAAGLYSPYNGGPTVTDLEGDGSVEVLFGGAILDGATGEVRVSGMWVQGDTFPAVADMDGDGVLEIGAGPNVWNADGSQRFGVNYLDWYTYATFVDLDGDGLPELLASGYLLGVAAYTADGTLIRRVGSGEAYSTVCVADLDADGLPEVIAPTTTELRVYDHALNPRWTAPASDPSGLASCSAFDFDADGASDVLYADEDRLRVFDGRTGDVLFEYGDHGSVTMWEYPVVADIDGDGSSEVVIAESAPPNEGLVVLGHTLEQWPPSDPWWSQYLTDGGDIVAGGRVSADPPEGWRQPGWVHARPPGHLGTTGAWDFDRLQPDLSVAITGVCAPACPADTIELAVSVTNTGPAAADATVHLYAVEVDGEREVGSATLTVRSGRRSDPIPFVLPATDAGEYGWRATVTPTDGGVDCDPSDDVDAWIDVPCAE